MFDNFDRKLKAMQQNLIEILEINNILTDP